ncbi:hypothetical protein EYR40_006591 [Pleurotus pulmonarius]|nr:hypothetical protein EYR40_006591 [Pleurotus pulmonarius]
MGSRRPLPALPTMRAEYYYDLPRSQAMYSATNPYFNSQVPYSPFSDHGAPDLREEPTSSVPVGTMLHKGFYDLLAMIPTPSPSRLLWGPPAPPSEPIVAGPRYEQIPAGIPPEIKPVAPAISANTSPTGLRKGRRISKDMVSHPTGFIHLVHASDADQAEALLTRWGPDGLGKLGDPRWANPIKDRVRQINQVRAVNEVVNALKPSQDSRDDFRGPLRVVNGISSVTSSTLTTAARKNFRVNPVHVEGLPGRPGNSTIRWEGGLKTHLEGKETEEHLPASENKDLLDLPPPPKKFITPSLATLEKAVSARIYFENLYFPLFRQPPSREQRRLAMEKDMVQMQLSEAQKENLRARWRQNETDYLRERRRKVDVSAFIKLKTIGHGAFGVVSLVKEQHTNQLYAMKQLRKADMLRKGQEGHVRAERDILKSASMVHSPGSAEWIVKLHYSFQDRDNLYLVLEYMGGGDLLNLLIERDVFEEDFTRFYVAEMVLAIESCHKLGFIHRDIKPDNFLFDPEGHIKLSDFGLATDLHWAHDTTYYEQQRLQLLHKHGIDLEDSNGLADGRKTRRMDRKEVELLMGGEGQGGIFTWRERNRRKLAYSVCGTNSYMSPEVIRGHGYSYSCDWWSLGVIMYECLYGFPPFVSNSAHPWFKGIDWANIHRYPAPYRPELRNPEDTKHFDPDIPPEPLAPANGAPADATKDLMLRDKVHGAEILDVRKALAFAGFTHKSPRAITYLRADQAFETTPDIDSNATVRGRPRVREMRDVGKGRAISM